ncbi:unnamed protein product, partial [marine sediment metagenome]
RPWLSPTFETEVIENGTEYEVFFNPLTYEITINDLNPLDGLLNKFDLISAVLNYSYGPTSSYSEIKLSKSFNETYLSDIEDSFYDYLTISFSYSEISGEILFEDGIEDEMYAFESIDYTRNPNTGGSDHILDGYDSTLFINFEMFEDPFNIVYEADLEMDGVKDYKQTIDVDKDGQIDITKFGIEDEYDPANIIWHTVIQDFESEEISFTETSEPEKRTKWFDIDDRTMSSYIPSIGTLLGFITPPTMLLTIAAM